MDQPISLATSLDHLVLFRGRLAGRRSAGRPALGEAAEQQVLGETSASGVVTGRLEMLSNQM